LFTTYEPKPATNRNIARIAKGTLSMNQNQPRIVTLPELQKVLFRYTFGWKWAEDAIVDLWKKGAPLPQAEGQPERRILLPTQFEKWWAELAQRMGYAANGRQSYNEISPLFRTSGGMGSVSTQRRR
jgi:hypothetical protein